LTGYVQIRDHDVGIGIEQDANVTVKFGEDSGPDKVGKTTTEIEVCDNLSDITGTPIKNDAAVVCGSTFRTDFQCDDACPGEGVLSASEDDEVTALMCGDVITTSVTLQGSLACRDSTSDAFFALAVVGADAVLDCQGNLIYNPDPPSNNVGILVRDGGTVKNCHVSGFFHGIFMNGGDAFISDSQAFSNNGSGMQTRDDGEDRDVNIQNALSFSNELAGFLFEHSGSVIMNGLQTFGNTVGLFIIGPEEVGRGLIVESKDFVALRNKFYGVRVAPGNLVFFNGFTSISKNGSQGLRSSGADELGTTIRMAGTVEITDNREQGVVLMGNTTISFDDTGDTDGNGVHGIFTSQSSEEDPRMGDNIYICNNGVDLAISGDPIPLFLSSDDIEIICGDSLNTGVECRNECVAGGARASHCDFVEPTRAPAISPYPSVSPYPTEATASPYPTPSPTPG
jgi:hypothetical protein